MASPVLKDYQVEGVNWLLQRDRAFLADEPGLGKTAQMLMVAEEPALVIAPAMVLDSGTWDDEIAKFTPGIDVTQVSYTSLCERGPKGRVEKDINGFPIVRAKEEYRRRWRTVICDESHYLKGRKTSWTVAVSKLECDRLILATGTPIPNWAHEAFTALQLLFPEEAKPGKAFGSYWRWVNEWFLVNQSRFNAQAREIGDLLEDRTWEEFNRENWRDRMILRKRDDVLTELPPLTEQKWVVKMQADQARAYREMKRDFVTWLDGGVEVSAWSTPAMLVKLAKCATGLESLSPGTVGSGKLDALKTILTDRPRQTLVVAHFQSSVEACYRAALSTGKKVAMVHGGSSSADRKGAIRSFQEGEIDVLCASIELISEGMTLHQGGADQVVRVERSFKPSKNEQVIRRLHRIGQERPVSVIDLVSKGTVDEKALILLKQKTDQQMQALDPEIINFLVR